MTHEQIQRALAAIVATLEEGRVLDATRDARHLLTTLGVFTAPAPRTNTCDVDPFEGFEEGEHVDF